MSDLDNREELKNPTFGNFEKNIGQPPVFNNDGNNEKKLKIKIDDEEYQLKITKEQDPKYILTLVANVNATIKEIRSKMPNLGYPQLFVLALLRAEEKSLALEKKCEEILQKTHFEENGLSERTDEKVNEQNTDRQEPLTHVASNEEKEKPNEELVENLKAINTLLSKIS